MVEMKNRFYQLRKAFPRPPCRPFHLIVMIFNLKWGLQKYVYPIWTKSTHRKKYATTKHIYLSMGNSTDRTMEFSSFTEKTWDPQILKCFPHPGWRIREVNRHYMVCYLMSWALLPLQNAVLGTKGQGEAIKGSPKYAGQKIHHF